MYKAPTAISSKYIIFTIFVLPSRQSPRKKTTGKSYRSAIVDNTAAVSSDYKITTSIKVTKSTGATRKSFRRIGNFIGTRSHNEVLLGHHHRGRRSLRDLPPTDRRRRIPSSKGNLPRIIHRRQRPNTGQTVDQKRTGDRRHVRTKTAEAARRNLRNYHSPSASSETAADFDSSPEAAAEFDFSTATHAECDASTEAGEDSSPDEEETSQKDARSHSVAGGGFGFGRRGFRVPRPVPRPHGRGHHDGRFDDRLSAALR